MDDRKRVAAALEHVRSAVRLLFEVESVDATGVIVEVLSAVSVVQSLARDVARPRRVDVEED